MRLSPTTTFGGATFVTLLAITVGACGPALQDEQHPTGSSTLVPSAQSEALYSVNTDQGTISKLDIATNTVVEIDVGLEPTRLARVGDELWVTLRGERKIAVLDIDASGDLELDRTIDAGAEPYGIVADEDGERVYVAMSLSGTVVEYDGETAQVLREWSFDDQPNWVALHPRGTALYVGSPYNASVHWIDLSDGDVARIQMPSAQGFDPTFFDEDLVDLTVRVTGDIGVSPDGRTLGVPTLYVNNTSGITTGDFEEGVQTGGGYASSGRTISRLNPVVVSVPLSRTGKPNAEQADAIFIPTSADIEGFNSEFTTVRSFPSSVTFSPNDYVMMVTMEGSSVVVAVPTLSTDALFFDDLDFTSPSSTLAVVTDTGPRGVTFAGGRAFVHNFIDGSIQDAEYQEVEDTLAMLNQDAGRFGFMGVDEKSFAGIRAGDAVTVTDEIFDAELAHGRNLFYSAIDSQMVASGGGVSCSTCHLDGRNDGLTWNLQSGLRNTPSLAGQVSLTAPVTWTEGVASIAAEAMLTSQGRMGGHGLQLSDVDAIERFVDFTRHADHDLKGSTSESALRGQALFSREDVGCAGCHNGPELTDNETYEMAGLTNVRTPGLAGVAVSAPYLHDGRLDSLRSVLEWARSGEMGDTSMLSESEMDDLETYLRTL